MEVRFLKNNLWVRDSTDPSGIGGPVPVISSLTRKTATPTSLQTVQWTAKFSQVVTGVGTADFSLVQGGGVTGATILSVADTGDSKSFLVSADSGTGPSSGSGSLGLNLVDDDTITNGTGQPLGGTGAGNGNFTGQVYVVNRAAPPPPTIVFGSSYNGDPTNLSGLLDAKWGVAVPATRCFSGGGNLPMQWNTASGSTKNGLTPDRHNIVSWKPTHGLTAGGSLDSQLNAWFAGAPTTFITDITIWHEADRPITQSGINNGGTIDSGWINDINHLISLVNAFGNPNIRVGVILTSGGSASSANRRWDWKLSTNQGYVQPGMKWVGLDFDGTPVVQTYPGASALTSANWYGWFANVPPPFMKGGYLDIPNIQAAGYEVIIPEWSWHKAGWDVTGTTGQPNQYYRSLVYKKAAALFRDAGVTTVTYWDNVGSTNQVTSPDPDFVYIQNLISGGPV